MNRKVGIITECVSDLPKAIVERYDIRMVYFLVKTKHGEFFDTRELTARNVFEYIGDTGEATISREPDPGVYRQIYENALEDYEELVHITISSKTSNSYFAAGKAVDDMGENGKKIHIFDSGHLSGGQGHLLIMACEMAENGASAKEILDRLSEAKQKVSTSFVVDSVDFLYVNGRLSERVRNLCKRFSLHPVLAMKNGELALHKIMAGNYNKVSKKYIKNTLKNSKKIDAKRVFLVHAGCSVKVQEWIQNEINNYCKPEELLVEEASATVSSNCGPNAFGILFLEK